MQINHTRLQNGLTLVHSQDSTTQMVSTSVLYRVGSANEVPQRTGLAHLLEHLMFGGSQNAPLFDPPLQEACGENNAFTTSDYTNYYITLPAVNIETALWLESDRMTRLNITDQTLEVQRKVVMEEFKLHYINQPYGDIHHLIAALCHPPGHPYSWPTIGLKLSQIADVPLEVVRDFYHRFYAPQNAILAVVGDITWERTQELVRKWFGALPPSVAPSEEHGLQSWTQGAQGWTPPGEPATVRRIHRKTVRRRVPNNVLVVAFLTPSACDARFKVFDVVSDLLATGKSSRLNRELVERQRLFLSIDACVLPRLGQGMLLIEGVPAEGVSMEQAEQALRTEVDKLRTQPILKRELEKTLNKFEASLAAQRSDCQAVAMQLAYYTMLGSPQTYNNELAAYRALTPRDVQQTIDEALHWRNAYVVRYLCRQ